MHPELGDDAGSYHVQMLPRANGDMLYLLATTPEGACVYLGDGGCTIYARRPALCRSFDCRKHYLILPREDRDNLVRLKLSSRAVFNAGRARLKSLSGGEREECLEKRAEFFA